MEDKGRLYGSIRRGFVFFLDAAVTHLWSQPDGVVSHEAGVGVVFDVLALDVMLQVEEGFAWSLYHLHHTHLHDVHLKTSSDKSRIKAKKTTLLLKNVHSNAMKGLLKIVFK